MDKTQLLGQMLLARNLVTHDQLVMALEEQKLTHEFLGAILVRRHYTKEEDFLKVLSEQTGVPYQQLKHQYIDWAVAGRFSPSLIMEHHCLPIRQEGTNITVAITNPLDASSIGQVEREAKNQKVCCVLVSQADMDEAIKTYQKIMAARINKMLDE